MSVFGSEELARDAISLIADGTEVATWNSKDYDGMVGPLVSSKPNVSGGFLPEYDLSWTTSLQKLNDSKELVSRFTNDTLPAEGNNLTIGGVNYKIDRVTKDPFASSMVQFDLINQNKH